MEEAGDPREDVLAKGKRGFRYASITTLGGSAPASTYTPLGDLFDEEAFRIISIESPDIRLQ